MNAQDFKNISREITNKDTLDIVYNEILIPLLKDTAEKKSNELEITNWQNNKTSKRLQKLGFNISLQHLCREEMLPYLINKGFNVKYSSYSTIICF